jgi:hypothetical protein
MDKCSCGDVAIDVGIRQLGYPMCRSCLKVEDVPDDTYYFSQYRFVPLDDDRALDDEIRESLNLHLIER